jgi:hypothetical protein
MDNTSRRDLLAGLAALPAALSQKVLGLLPPATTKEKSGGPGALKIDPPSQSVMRRG